MILLKIKSIRETRQHANLGIELKDSTRIVDCIVNINAITHFESDPDNPNITNILLTSGLSIRTPMSSDNFMINLIQLASQTRDEDDEVYEEDGSPAKSDDNGEY